MHQRIKEHHINSKSSIFQHKKTRIITTQLTNEGRNGCCQKKHWKYLQKRWPSLHFLHKMNTSFWLFHKKCGMIFGSSTLKNDFMGRRRNDDVISVEDFSPPLFRFFESFLTPLRSTLNRWGSQLFPKWRIQVWSKQKSDASHF